MYDIEERSGEIPSLCLSLGGRIGIRSKDVPARVGAPPLDTTSEHAGTDEVCWPCQWGTHSILHIMNNDVPTGVGAPPLDTQLLFSNAKLCVLGTGFLLVQKVQTCAPP